VRYTAEKRRSARKSVFRSREEHYRAQRRFTAIMGLLVTMLSASSIKWGAIIRRKR
jgi:hypothetical protein